MSETTAVQDYLKALYQLGGSSASVPTSDLAARLRVRPASVSGMVRRLDELGLVSYAKYKGARLTRRGVRAAVEVIRHHRLLELYLARVRVLEAVPLGGGVRVRGKGVDRVRGAAGSDAVFVEPVAETAR